MEDTKNKKLSAKLLAIAIAAALALSAAPVLAEDKTPVDLEGTITGWQEGNGGPGSLEAGSANADGKMSIAIGDESSKDAGNGATASGENSIAIGGASSKASGALATGQDAIAIGAGTVASNARATSIGALAEASGISASAFGHGAVASGNDSSAFGYHSLAKGQRAVAIGGQASATGLNSTAVGSSAAAHSTESIALGDATVDKDAEYGIAIGNSARAFATNATALGRGASAGEENAVAIGTSAHAQKVNAIAIGNSSNAQYENSIAIGNSAKVFGGYNGIALGNNSSVAGRESLALGANSEIGQRAVNSVALGTNSKVEDDAINTVSVGNSKYTNADGTTGLYRRITNMAAGINDYDAVNVSQLKAYGGSVAKILGGENGPVRYDTSKNTLSVTGTPFAGSDNVAGGFNNLNEKINNLGNSVADILNLSGNYDEATGQISGTWAADENLQDQITKHETTLQAHEKSINSHEATLQAHEKSINSHETTLTAHEKSINSHETTLTAHEKSINSHETTLQAHENSINSHEATLQAHENSINSHETTLTAHDKEFKTLQDVLGSGYSNPTFNSLRVGNVSFDGTNINMGGGRITGLADGGIYRGSTDAVTGNQLWDAYQRMDDMQEGINIVGAHAAALSGLHPIDYNPFEPTTLSAAVGTYRDEYAVAVGVFHYMRENVLFNMGASLCSDGDVMGRAGISFTVGRGGDKKKALAPKDMNEVQAQLAQVQQTLAELKAENEALKVKLEEK